MKVSMAFRRREYKQSRPRSPCNNHALVEAFELKQREVALIQQAFERCLRDASIKRLNRGCGAVGRDLNSGWNWQPRNQG